MKKMLLTITLLSTLCMHVDVKPLSKAGQLKRDAQCASPEWMRKKLKINCSPEEVASARKKAAGAAGIALGAATAAVAAGVGAREYLDLKKIGNTQFERTEYAGTFLQELHQAKSPNDVQKAANTARNIAQTLYGSGFSKNENNLHSALRFIAQKYTDTVESLKDKASSDPDIGSNMFDSIKPTLPLPSEDNSMERRRFFDQ